MNPSTSPKAKGPSNWHKKIAANRGLKWRKNIALGRRDAQLNPSNIRLQRLKIGVQQEDIAKQLKISESTFGSIERGKRLVKLDVAKQISQRLKLPLNKLFKSKSKNKYVALINRPAI